MTSPDCLTVPPDEMSMKERTAYIQGVAAVRAALINEFGETTGFTGRLMDIIDKVDLSKSDTEDVYGD